MTEPVELIVSASSMKEYLTCGYRYLLSSVWRVPGAPNMDMAIGTAVHAGVEALHKALPEPLEATETALLAELDKVRGPDPTSPSRAMNEASDMYRLYAAKIAPTFKPTMIERSFVTRINGYLFAGQIDVADDTDAVRDTKTTASLTKFKPERHRVQMTGYRFGFKSITGRWPTRLLLDVVTRNLKWKTVEIEPDQDEFITSLTLTQRGILGGDYEPTGASSGACARCPYSTGVCRYARLD
jgi:hypothetical protein